MPLDRAQPRESRNDILILSTSQRVGIAKDALVAVVLRGGRS
jgi:hypothetical protein